MDPIILDTKAADAARFYEKRYVGAQPLFLRPGTKLVLGGTDARRCRFCDRDSADATFRTAAHAIPELLGNKTLFTLEECDQCNAFFRFHD